MLIGYRTSSCSNSESKIMKPSIILSALAALMAISVPAAAQDERFDWQRADRNYQDLLRGTKQLAQLPYFERLELIEYRRWLEEGTRDTRTRHQKCMDEEIERLGPNPTYLGMRTARMKCRGEEER